jgi:6,7-dimethyl-8-ribityllumazine synthase
LGAVKQVAGSLDASSLTFALVVSRFNETLTHALVEAAVGSLRECGAPEESITVYWVPGGYEVPALAEQIAAHGDVDAIVALGAVIEGETPHADMINVQVTHSLTDISRKYGIPVIHEVVAARNMEQAAARCTAGRQSRGWYAGLAAVEMAQVFKQVRK